MNPAKYDWNCSLDAGTIICSHYSNFDGVRCDGIFMVIYDEQKDNYNMDKKNILALKVSTQQTCITNYSVNINAEKNSFLNQPCIVCCNKIHTLHKQKEIYKVLGKLDTGTYKRVYKTLNKVLTEIANQNIEIL